MSLAEFPPIGSSPDCIYCLEEQNGTLVYVTLEQLRSAVTASELLSSYPVIAKSQMQEAQQSFDSDRETFADCHANQFQIAVDTWRKSGISGLLEYVVNISDGSQYGSWIASAGRMCKAVEEKTEKIFSSNDDDLVNLIERSSNTLNWKTNWVRCIAIHSNLIAVCQRNNCVCVYEVKQANKAPIMLKHHQQTNVADMSWNPYDRFMLAVACDKALLIWKLDLHSLKKSHASHAQVIDLHSFSPVTQCLWDTCFPQALFLASPSSSNVIVLDTGNQSTESLGSWSRSRVRRFWLSPDATKLLVAYECNSITVFDRHCWREECWKNLRGKCIAAAWSPQSNFVLFATEDESVIRCINFVKNNLNVDSSSRGSDHAVPVFDVSKLEVGDERGSVRYTVGGSVRDIQISPDGQRVAVAFAENSMIALFIVGYEPSFFMTPSGVIPGGQLGCATNMIFQPQFSYGSLLVIVWSSGEIQYIPLFYGRHIDQEEFLSLSKSRVIGELANNVNEWLIGDSAEIRQVSIDDSDEQEKSGDLKLFSTVGMYDKLVKSSSAECD